MERKNARKGARGKTDFTWPIAILRREGWAVLFAQRDRSFPLYLVTILSESTWFHSKKPLQNYFNFFCQRSSWHRRFSRYFPRIRHSPRTTLSRPLVLPPSLSSILSFLPFSRLARRISLQSSRADWHACCSITRSRTSGLLFFPLRPRNNANIPIVILLPSVSSSVF